MEALGEGHCFGVFALNLGRSENADRTPTGQRWARWRDHGAGPNRGIEDRAGDADFPREITGQGKVITRIGDHFDDRPKCSIGSDGQTYVGGSVAGSDRGLLAESLIDDEGNDEDNCKQERSDHEHHECKR